MKTPFHFWSEDGSVIPLALALQREGHPVTIYLKDPEAQHMGEGVLARATDPPAGAVVIFDCVGAGKTGQMYRKRGHPVIGGNPFDVTLERDRMAGITIMHAAGIATPPTFPFTAVGPACAFLKTQDGAWFVKVSGQQADSASTYNSPDPDMMIRYLTFASQQGPLQPFELQQTIRGTEVSCNGWFNGHEFVTPFDITVEDKHLLNGDLGPRTGCESNVVWMASDDRLALRTVAKIEGRLEREGYVGPVDLNSMVTSEGTPMGLEWTARLGFDAIQAWMRLFEGDLGEQLEAFASGELDEWEVPDLDRLSVTARLSIPPYPSGDPKATAKTRGTPLDARVLSDRRFDPVDIMQSENGLVAAGGSGIIGTAASVGPDLDVCRDECRAILRPLVVPKKQYRTHLIPRAQRDLAELSRLKLLGHAPITAGPH